MRQNDEKSINKALIEYEYIIKIILSKYKIIPKDYDDALQEGRLGLLKAIRAFKDNKGANFTSFASLCIDRQILSFLRNQGRKKNKIHQYSYSLDSYYTEVEISKLSHMKNNIEDYIFAKMHYENVYHKALVQMSYLEKNIYRYYITGYTIQELSKEYQIPKKQVYVIIAKAKKKIEQKLNQY
ncbi:sigma-70 family RNA polymerase sigma factor [Mycoplasmatota bacterium]|nr:sigma-70 family RNA polymerase sigma factor [Mycoplasmatota bacterium]